MDTDIIEVKTIQPLAFVARRVRGPGTCIDAALRDVQRSVEERFHGSGAHLAGSPFVLFHSPPAERDRVDVEVAVPVAGQLSSTGDVHAGELGQAMVATLVHEGSDVGAAYRRLLAWIPAHGYEVAGPARETPMHANDASATLTEIAIPIRSTVG